MSSYVLLWHLMTSYVIVYHLMSSCDIPFTPLTSAMDIARLPNFLETDSLTHPLTHWPLLFLEGPSPLKILGFQWRKNFWRPPIHPLKKPIYGWQKGQKAVVGAQNIRYDFLRVGGDVSRLLCRNLHQKISACFDGGPSGGSSVRRLRFSFFFLSYSLTFLPLFCTNTGEGNSPKCVLY